MITMRKERMKDKIMDVARWRDKIALKLRAEEVENLSDSEIIRALKNCVTSSRAIDIALALRDYGLLRQIDITSDEALDHIRKEGLK